MPASYAMLHGPRSEVCWEVKMIEDVNVRQVCGLENVLNTFRAFMSDTSPKEQVTLQCNDCSASSEVFLTSSECFMGIAQENADL